MKCLQFNQFGDTEKVLNIVEINIPKIKVDEVKVKMLLRPINPYELMIVQGVYSFRPSLPAVTGFEDVGIIESI